MQRRILTESRRQSVGSKARRTHARTSQPFVQLVESFAQTPQPPLAWTPQPAEPFALTPQPPLAWTPQLPQPFV